MHTRSEKWLKQPPLSKSLLRMAPKSSRATAAALPATGVVPRRAYYLKGVTRLNRSQLEEVAPRWGVATEGRTMPQIVDLLFIADRHYYENGVLPAAPIQNRDQWIPAVPREVLEQAQTVQPTPPQRRGPQLYSRRKGQQSAALEQAEVLSQEVQVITPRRQAAGLGLKSSASSSHSPGELFVPSALKDRLALAQSLPLPDDRSVSPWTRVTPRPSLRPPSFGTGEIVDDDNASTENKPNKRRSSSPAPALMVKPSELSNLEELLVKARTQASRELPDKATESDVVCKTAHLMAQWAREQEEVDREESEWTSLVESSLHQRPPMGAPLALSPR